MAKLIKAFHQVGGDDRTPAERRAFLDQILKLGEIVPAIERVQRREMYNECFTAEAQGGQAVDAIGHGASSEVQEALSLMAKEKLELLPRDGTTHTMFNCLDLIAGDFELVFLSVRDWYSYPSGFVFDAEKLLMSGARYRTRDLLGYYNHAVKEVGEYTYDSAEDARREIEGEFQVIRRKFETTGKEAVTLLRADCSSKDGCPGEIVWPGSLPLGLAIEMWREGRKVSFREGARR